MRGFEKIEGILAAFLGAPKNGTDKEQQQYNCPCCAQDNGGVPDGKYNLEVNLLLGKYHCWKCSEIDGTKGNLGKLVKMYGGQSLYKQYRIEIDDIIKSKLYNIQDYSGVSTENFIVKEPIRLPKTYRKVNLNGYCKPAVKEYLEKRKIDQSIIDKFNIGYTEYEEDEKNRGWSYRIIIPSYDEYGDLNFYVGRDYTDNKKRPTYKNVDTDKKEIVFQESLINWDADIVLVEGAIDCLYFPNSISLLGKSLAEDSKLYRELVSRSNANVILCLDSDTQLSESKKIYSSLNRGRLKGRVRYLSPGKYKDFGELYEKEGKKGIVSTVKNARELKEYELL